MKKRVLSVVLALSLCIPMLTPIGTLATAAEDSVNDCTHHLEHDFECGYIEAVEGQPCAHIHSDACGFLKGAEEIAEENDVCTHQHDADCGYVEAIVGHPCEFVCEICNNYTVVDWTWVDDYEMLAPASDYSWAGGADWVFAYPNMNGDDLLALLPSAVIAAVDTREAVRLDITWDMDRKERWVPEGAEDAAVGTVFYYLSAQLPDGFTLADEAPAMTILVQTTEIDTLEADVMPAAVATDSGELHFIIRHWHSKENDEGSMFGNGSGETMDSSGNRYFVLVDGYIQPPASSDGEYRFFLTDPTDPDGNKVEIHRSEGKDHSVADSQYIDELDHENGTIILSTNALKKDNGIDSAEDFSAYSISAGHDAVETQGDKLVITYNENVHLVKAHAFYVRTTVDTENGMQEDTVFGTNGIAMSTEQDTAMVYTYSKDVGAGNSAHKKGEIVQVNGKPFTVFKIDENGNHIVDKEALKAAGIQDTDAVKVTKVYDSSAGLHTDKTAVVHVEPVLDQDGKPTFDPETGELLTTTPDGRTFDLDLEAWHSEGLAPQIGMVLDASGSMAFASDKPTPIKVERDTELYKALKDKIGTYDDNFQIEDPLMGYYEFRQNDGTNREYYRLWYFNSANKDGYKYTDFNSADYFSGKNNAFAKAAKRVSLNGSEIDFTITTNGVTHPSSFRDVFYPDYTCSGGWGANQAPAKFSASSGFSLSSTAANSAFVPEKQPTGGRFTLSFTLSQDAPADPFTGSERIEILYIGSDKNSINNDDYFHVYREGANVIACMGLNGMPLFTLPTNFSQGVNHKITFVFDEGMVTAYMDGLCKGSGDISLSGHTVVFAPFERGYSYGSDNYLNLDNIYLFDTALNDSQVNTLLSVSGATIENVRSAMGFDAFLTPWELALLMDHRSTDNSLLGWAGYSYFVYNSQATTMAYCPLAYYNNGANGAKFAETGNMNVKGDGWYYVSGSSWTDFQNANYETAKNVRGTAKGTYTDTITLGETYLDKTDGKGGVAPDVTINDGDSSTNTNYFYTAAEASPIKFYLDKHGYLRCFFATNDSNRMTSYVYEMEDSEYIRTEALQRALGLFVTELEERFHSARVSAVRFSHKDSKDDLEKMVLLDWTDDPAVSTGMLSLGQDNNKTYKYALTGGTSTDLGLKTYIDYLMDNDNPYTEGDPDKYLILFTDGANDGNEGDAVTYANQLKAAGYTIYTVLLDGGSMSTETYNKAEKFLTTLAGGNGSRSEDCFYSTQKSRTEDTSGKYANVGDADVLTQVFVNDILTKIAHPLDHYTIQDYLDPRFDLVDEYKNTWYLKANGLVVGPKYALDTTTGKVMLDSAGSPIIEDKNHHFYLKVNGNVTIPLSDHSDEAARRPYLRYDGGRDLYYLRWEEQTIPGSAIGEKLLPVWNARVTIRAKEDFIGGNAVLTNGTGAMMNYVYQAGDNDASSGAEHSKFDKTNWPDNGVNKLSKGFPRVSVNVTPSREDVALDQIIYMGETLNRDEIAQMIIDEAKKDASATVAKYYWEYVGRFVAYFNSIAGTAEGDKIIETLHQMNRSGEYIPADQDDYLELGHMKIISNRIYDLIYGRGGESGKDALSVVNLSKLLMSDATIFNEETGKYDETTERYLYIPYIYLPDDPKNQTNSTGKGEYLGDVIGYLFFHIEEQAEDSYEKYPENGVTTDTKPRRSRLTVSFLVRSSEDRAEWNNSQAIQETVDGNEPGLVPVGNPALFVDSKYGVNPASDPNFQNAAADRVYSRDTSNKPAAGDDTDTEKDPIVVRGTFTTEIVSGGIALQLRLTPEQADDLANKTFTYVADVYRDGEPIGEITYSGTGGGDRTRSYAAVAAGDDTGTLQSDKLITAAFTPISDAYNYINEYGFPQGIYTVETNQNKCVRPEGYKFGEVKIVEDPNQYTDSLFDNGTDNNTPKDYLGTLNSKGNSAQLGDEKLNESHNDAEAYLSTRYALFRVPLEPVGDLEIEKTAIWDPACSQHSADDTFTFNVTLEEPEPEGPEEPEVPDTSVPGMTTADDPVADPEKPVDPESPKEEKVIYPTVLTNADGTKQEGTVTFKDGVGEVQLKHGQMILIKDLPAGYGYQVEEKDAPGYVLVETKTSGDTGTIQQADVVNAKFTNQAVHSLTVSKTVTGSQGNKNKDWNFTITLKDSSGQPISGTYGGITFNAQGVGTTTMKHNGIVTFNDLPCGATFVVTEAEADTDGYSTRATANGSTYANGGNGKLLRNTTVNFVNSNPAGGVFISKTAESTESYDTTGREYTFNLTLTGADGRPASGTYDYTGDKNGTLSFDTDGKATLTLKHGQTIQIERIPDDYTLTVEESESGFTTTNTLTVAEYSSGIRKEKGTTDGTTTATTGKLAGSEYQYAFDFKNVRNKHSLTLTKNVSGNLGNLNNEFTFRITLTDPNSTTLTGTYTFVSPNNGRVTFVNGVAQVTLKHGDTITIPDLPEGIAYEIVETGGADSYVTTITGADKNNGNARMASGTLSENVFVTYENKRQAGIPTDATSEHMWLIAIFLASGIGLARIVSKYLVGMHRRRRKSLHLQKGSPSRM